MGKEVKYDLSFYNDRVQTLRQFELDIFDLDCPVASNSELSRFGKGNSLKSRLKQKLGWDKEKIYEENLDLGYQPRIFELDDIYLSGYWQSELYFKDEPSGIPYPADFVERIGTERIAMLERMMEKGVNTPYTSSAGRLFDAVASLLGICDVSSHQAEAPVLLEQAAMGEKIGRAHV